MNGVLHLGGLEISFPIVTLGFVQGMAYGLLAVGIVLVYRANKVINFAHGEIGAFGAAVFGVAVVKWHIPYWLALPIGIGVAGLVGAFAEFAVIRRLRNAPTLMSIVATLGVSQLLFFLSFVVNSSASNGASFPQPSGFPSFNVGTLVLTKAYVGILLLGPALVIGLGLFFSRSRYGLAMRASASNPEAARMAGVFSARMSTLAWAIAGGVAGLTAILLKPGIGFASAETLGPGLLLRALTAAVIARMASLPIALGAGVGVGIVESVLAQSFPDSGAVEITLFLIILITLLVQTRAGGRAEDGGSWASVQPWVPLRREVRDAGFVRFLGTGSGILLALTLLLLPVFISNEIATTFVLILAVSVVGLSVGIVTGLGGQLSLGQFALAGIGGAISIKVADATGYFPLAFLAAGAVAALVSVLVGLPAMRIKGLLLAVTTLSFAIATENWLLQQPWMLGEGKIPGRPIIAHHALDTGHSYYLFTAATFFIALLFARNIWRSGLGRRLRALRDNEDGARAFSVHAVRVKLQTFALAGFLAGVGGALYAHALSNVTGDIFSVTASINAVALTVIGGIGVLVGPLLGAFYIIGIPRFVPISSGALAASSFGWLLLILYFPGGLAQLVAPIRERIVRFAARGEVDRLDPEVRDEEHDRDGEELGADMQSAAAGALLNIREPLDSARSNAEPIPLLQVRGLSKRFGGVQAVDGIDLDVFTGETLGLIGPNGAGKTTLFEMLGGFTKADSGRVLYAGTDITALSPERRAERGLIRSFQNAALFPTLTVLETVQLSLERNAPTNTFTALSGWRGPDSRKESKARELVELMGLSSYVDKQTRELSTGTRRITELACVIALEPELLLLDEPSSGVAQRETEALGELLAVVKAHLGATLIVIEHDMPLIMGISDRVFAMDAGRALALGSPQEVIADPKVLESYLGGSAIAVERSGANKKEKQSGGRSSSAASTRRTALKCSTTTRSGSPCTRSAVHDGQCRQHAGVLSSR